MTGDVKHLPDDCVRLAMSGNDDARADLIHCWYGRVYALCQARLRCRADAEDAAQETFTRGLQRLENLRSHEAVGAWLRGIAHHVCVDVIRRNRVRQSTNGNIADVPAAGDNVVGRDEQAYLIGLIHDLPQQYRETVLLHYYEDMTYDEIASWLGVARSTVNERLSKARSLLKHKLLSQEVFDEV